MSDERTLWEGRVWMQFQKFQVYKPYLLGGMSDLTERKGALTPSRSPSRTHHGQVVSDVLRGSPDLGGFTLSTRLQKAKNFLLNLNCAVNVQAHLGKCDAPDIYDASHTIFHMGQAHPMDLTVPQVSIIEGDNAKIEMSRPFSFVHGPYYLDMSKYFVSQRTYTEAGDILDMVFFGEECIENCDAQWEAGEVGYIAPDAYEASPTDVAQISYTTDKATTIAAISAQPFAAGESVSCLLKAGIVDNHRLIAFRGTTDAANPAECAYADVTVMGTVAWTNVDIGSTNGEYVNYGYYLDDANVYCVTDQGNIYKSEDGAASWSSVYSGANALYDISVLPDGTVWAVGAGNTVLLSEDEGEAFTAITGPDAAQGNTTVTVTPDGTVFVGNDAGALYGSYRKARTVAADWSERALQGATCTDVQRVRHYGDDIIVAIGNIADGSGRCWYSPDGGASFKLWSLEMPDNLGLNALVVVNPNLIYVGGNAYPVAGTAFLTRTTFNLFGVG